MDAKAEKMTQPWSCAPPFVKMKTQIEDGGSYAKAGNYDMSHKRIVCIAFKLVTNTNQLDHAIRE